jgi:3-deoxy-7-phosphoheptulonate synthase
MECEPTGNAIATIAARPKWAPGSWRKCESLQMAEYEDKATYQQVIDKLSALPTLVHHAEVDKLTETLAAAGRGEQFIIQGGDCAERFVDCQGGRLDQQVKLMMQMAALVESGTGMKVVRVARLAGQYGKPRSKPTETVEGWGEIHSFKGDNINGYELADRKWNPSRLLEGYWHSTATLNYVRSLQMAEDFGASTVGTINLDALSASPRAGAWSKVGEAARASAGSTKASLFTSHEAMQLDLEEALTREVAGKGFYNLSAHMVWIGDRTRQLLGGHVEYFRGIRNPIGCKVGPSMTPDELKELVQVLNPDRVPGRLVLITRYGRAKVEALLPAHIKAVAESGVPVVWESDGVHGNTVTAAANKLKTRKFEDVMGELTAAIRIHRENGSVLGGVHIEMTGQETVTECTGGLANICEDMLTQNYETYCDPRLNFAQSIEASLVLADALGQR